MPNSICGNLDNVGNDRLNLPVAGRQLRVVPGDATTVNLVLFFPFLDAIVVTPVGEWVSISFIISNLQSASAIAGNLILPSYLLTCILNYVHTSLLTYCPASSSDLAGPRPLLLWWPLPSPSLLTKSFSKLAFSSLSYF